GNLNASRAGAVRDLTDLGTQAAAGQIAATRAAHDQLVTDLTKILESKKDLAGQRGAFKAATIGDLEEAARERATRGKIASAGNKLKLPTIAGDYVQAAVDLEKRGGVTHKTAQTLHSRGLSLKQLGIPSMGSRKGKTQASVQHGFDVVQALLDQLGG